MLKRLEKALRPEHVESKMEHKCSEVMITALI